MDTNFKTERYFGKNEDRYNHIGKYYIKDTKGTVASFNITDINWVCRIATIELELLNNIDDDKKQHYVHNIIKSMVDYIYKELNLIKIKTQQYSNNEELIVFFQNFGFEVEGFLKNELFSNGQFYDFIYLALFKDQYNDNTIIIKSNEINDIEDNTAKIELSTDSSLIPIKKLGSLFSLDIEKRKH